MQLYLPIAEIPVNIFLLLGLGASIGFISGLFGVGGGFLLTPLLIFLGIPPAVAVATSSVQIAATSTTGVLNYWRRKALDFKLGAVLVVGGFVGTLLGVWLFNAMRKIGQLDLVITISYVTLLLGMGLFMLAESLRAMFKPPQSRPKRLERTHSRRFDSLPGKMLFQRSQLNVSIFPLLLLGVGIGIVGTLLGIGGGFLVVPALIYIFKVPTNIVVGTSQFQIFFTTIAAAMLHAVTNQSVDILLALVLIVGGVIGAQFGARAGMGLRGESFRLMLALLIFIVGFRFAADIALVPTELFSLGVSEIRR